MVAFRLSLNSKNAFAMQLKLLLLTLTTFWVSLHGLRAQLCTGSLGDPVVNITFGAGQNPGAPLSSTNYQYVTTDCPNDGQYTIRNNSIACYGTTWHTINSDHTGDPNGYFMLVNASYSPGDFFVQTVNGLCGNTSYEFAAWVANVQHPVSCNGRAIKPNLSFTIETTSGTVLATFTSGDIELTSSPQWKQYGTFFTTPANVSSVVIRLTNNAPGGCGNDIALDDITFRPCGGTISAVIEGANTTQMEICATGNIAQKFVATVPGSYARPELQWQQSLNGGQTWTNIADAKGREYAWSETKPGTYYYRALVAEEGNINSVSCRIASKPIIIRISEAPEVTLASNVAFCEGLLLQLDIPVKIADTAGLRLSWTGPPGSDLTLYEIGESSGRVFRLSKSEASFADTGWYNITVTNGEGCAVTGRVHFYVFKKPVANLSVQGPACADSPVQLAGGGSSNSGFTAFKWKWGTGDSARGQRIAPVLGPAGNYRVELVVVDAEGCPSDPVKTDVQVNKRPTPLFALPEICLTDAAAQFTNLTVTDGSEPATYQWRFGDAANPDAGSTEKNPRYRYTAVGNYPVTLSVVSAAGCAADTTQTFTVNGSKPNAQFTLNTVAVRCSGDSVVLRNNSSVDFGSVTRLEIFWKGDNDAAARTIDEKPTAGKEYRFNYTPFVTGGQQKFTISMVAYSGESCMHQTVQEIEVQQSPKVVFDALPALCQGAPAFLLSSAREVAGAVGQGRYSGTGVNGQGMFNPALPGDYPIQYLFTTGAGCTDTAMQTVQVWPLPQVQAGPDKTVVAGGGVTLAATALGEGLQIQWSPANGLNDATTLQPLASPETETIYTLTATTNRGCTASDDVKVFTIPEVYIPNAFTPNGDGINDTWQVPYLESMPEAEVRVFNRYGQEVYRAKGAARGWNGKVGGKDQPTGAFVYLLKMKGGKMLRGTVMLVR